MLYATTITPTNNIIIIFIFILILFPCNTYEVLLFWVVIEELINWTLVLPSANTQYQKIQYSRARIFRILFSKRCTFGSKWGTEFLLRYTRKIRKNCSRVFEGLSYLAYKMLQKWCLVIFSIHIIQLSLFSSEYLPLYLLKFGGGGDLHPPPLWFLNTPLFSNLVAISDLVHQIQPLVQN